MNPEIIKKEKKINITVQSEAVILYVTKNTETLEITGNFDQTIDLDNKLIKIEFYEEFNQPIILPDRLIRLNIDGDFNKPIILPDSLSLLRISGNFNQPITLPTNITSLDFKNKIYIK